jgi:hypothetical protein
MKLKYILFSAVLFALILLAAAASSVSACEGLDENDLRCAAWHLPKPTVTPNPTRLPTPSPTPIRRGTSPSDAMEITDTWSSIEPGANLWFKASDSTGFSILEVWVDTPTQNALGLALYSPEQTKGPWSDWKPIGRGSFNKATANHVLIWKAAYARAGIWYAQLSNLTSSPVFYKIGSNQTNRDPKECFSYWEDLTTPWDGVTHRVYWTDCGKR